MKRMIFLIACLSLILTGCAASEDPAAESRPPISAQQEITESTATAPAPISSPTPADPSVFIAQCEEPFSLTFPRAPSPDGIAAFLHNASGQEAQVLLIPTLERKSEDGSWETVPFRAKIGFCGVPDPLPCEGKEWSVDTQLLYGSLSVGTYRLSCTVTHAGGSEYTVSNTFLIGEAASLCGYPTADHFG